MKRQNISRARSLRINRTDAEARLWLHLRNRMLGGAKFRRQVPVGPYIADFLCAEHMLIVELDGGQHADNPADERRTRFLESKGYRVIRFWNPDVLTNTDGVLEMILTELDKTPHPSHRRA
ncbi:MAG: endonuclease domain-containing protein [Parvibaculum sp.]|uniref:endonuclease domain-containing protein n=1 Tax=Parvibaculum sp. TaxID=2024848 RepID=UPI002726484D|nr:endonuclease domain-containing protein [Parvibaculum sp.]MDO8837837.1 endonuclease domain-containing protein [Parvibaculum sp.]